MAVRLSSTVRAVRLSTLATALAGGDEPRLYALCHGSVPVLCGPLVSRPRHRKRYSSLPRTTKADAGPPLRVHLVRTTLPEQQPAPRTTTSDDAAARGRRRVAQPRQAVVLAPEEQAEARVQRRLRLLRERERAQPRELGEPPGGGRRKVLPLLAAGSGLLRPRPAGSRRRSGVRRSGQSLPTVQGGRRGALIKPARRRLQTSCAASQARAPAARSRRRARARAPRAPRSRARGGSAGPPRS